MKEKRGRRLLALQRRSFSLGLAGELLQRVLVAQREPDTEPKQKARAHGQADEERGHLFLRDDAAFDAAPVTLS
jgi:hypothetical protein